MGTLFFSFSSQNTKHRAISSDIWADLATKQRETDALGGQ
jgi:hypothetical protein